MSSDFVRARFLFKEVTEKGFDLPLGSVTKDGGVEFRSDLNVAVWNPGEDVSGYKRVRPDDFVIGLRSFQSGIGRSSIEALVSPAYTVLRPISQDVYPPFFRYLFKSSAYISRLENVAQGIRQGRTISTEDFYNIEVRKPALAEQKAIADYLDRETTRIDALIEKKKRLTELASELVGSKIESVLDKFASNCPRPSLAYVLAAPITDGPHETPEFTESGVPFLSVDNIQESQINFSDTRFISNEENVRFSRKSKPRPGDVLLTKAASVGKVALVATDLEFNIWSPIAILRPNHEILSSEYLWWLFRSPRIQMQLQLYATSNTQQNISMRDLSSIRLDVPSLDTQVQCVNQLNKVDAWSRSLMTKISKDTDLLKERRQALITGVVTGELEIPEVAA